jgi:hypothetical protein
MLSKENERKILLFERKKKQLTLDDWQGRLEIIGDWILGFNGTCQ